MWNYIQWIYCLKIDAVGPSAYDNGQSSDISGQFMHLTGQTKFGQTNFLYIIIEKQCPDNFQWDQENLSLYIKQVSLI